MSFDDIIGKSFNEWKVIGYDDFKVVGIEKGKERKRHFYNCECTCGNIRSIERRNIISGKSKSCGHKNRENIGKISFKHGLSTNRLFRIYKEMISRCNNRKNKDYKNYGNRGIIVCNEWVNDFETFQMWAMNNGYNETLTIDRIDNNGNYESSNCRWVISKKQTLNRRNSITITAISPDGIVYENISDILEFAKTHNLTTSKIYDCVNGRGNHHKKWKFMKNNIDKDKN